MDHLPTKHQEERGDGYGEPCRKKDTTEPGLRKSITRQHYKRKHTPELLLTLQFISAVTLYPTNSRKITPQPNSRAVIYTTKDHFHGRLPQNTSHSNSRVVTTSHLWQVAVKHSKRTAAQQDENAHVDTAE